jgi:hypothetical protein
MDDTLPETKEILNKLYAKFTAEERLLIGLRMFETAREIVISSFPSSLTEKEIRERLFLRFYGNEFTAKETEEIFKRMSQI